MGAQRVWKDSRRFRYGPHVAAPEENLRIRVPLPLKGKWDNVTTAHKISQQAAALALMEWFVQQDPMLRSMVLGQIPEVDPSDLAKLALRRLAAGGRPAGKGNLHGGV